MIQRLNLESSGRTESTWFVARRAPVLPREGFGLSEFPPWQTKPGLIRVGSLATQQSIGPPVRGAGVALQRD